MKQVDFHIPGFDFCESTLFRLAETIVASSGYRISDLSPSEFSEKHITLDSDVTARPGPFRFENSPYTREIIDCASPDSDAYVIAVMKSSQGGASQALIGLLLWIISQNPGPTVWLASLKEKVGDFVSNRIDTAIDSAGMRHLIRPGALRARKAETGDKAMSKKFAGGSVIFGGIQRLGDSMRQDPFSKAIIDDYDSAPVEDRKGGDPFELIMARGASYGERIRYFFISTPQVMGKSNIYPLYIKGDQRRWHVSCPHCGMNIIFEFRPKDSDGKPIRIDKKATGLIFDVENDRVVPSSVRYMCQLCRGEIFEKEKYPIILDGGYLPTNPNPFRGYRSYHFDRMIYLKGQYSWLQICEEFQTAKPRGGVPDIKKLRTFQNLTNGMPFEERGRKIKLHNQSKKIRPYDIGIIPSDLSDQDGNGEIVLCTISFDLNGLHDDARVDYEIQAVSEKGASYSIDQGSIGTFQPAAIRRNFNEEKRRTYSNDRRKWTYEHGEIDNVWEEMERIARASIPDNNGEIYHNLIALIDCSQTFTDAQTNEQRAYRFIDEMAIYPSPRTFFFAVKGISKVTLVDRNAKIVKKSESRQNLWILDVNPLKDELADCMDLNWNPQEVNSQPAGFPNFPTPVGGKYQKDTYFKHFEAEEKIAIKNENGIITHHGWKPISDFAQNHFWDCKVYNIAAKYIAISIICDSLKNKGISPTWTVFANIMKFARKKQNINVK